MGIFSSGLFQPGSGRDRADGAAFDASVSGTPGASREQVKRLAEGEARATKALRGGAGNGGVSRSGLAEAWDDSTAEDKNAFGRYIHSRPRPW
jgi:hypothetical protein